MAVRAQAPQPTAVPRPRRADAWVAILHLFSGHRRVADYQYCSPKLCSLPPIAFVSPWTLLPVAAMLISAGPKSGNSGTTESLPD
eukprot:7580742-Lingulodinium_polyedra.AAC.1